MNCVSCCRYIPEGYGHVCAICMTKVDIQTRKAEEILMEKSRAEAELVSASGYSVNRLTNLFLEGRVFVR